MYFFTRGFSVLTLGCLLLSGAWSQAQQLPGMPELPQAPGAGVPGLTPHLDHCADEGGNCAFTGVRQVTYGADGKFKELVAADGVPCNNGTFGDPAVGARKACYLSGGPLAECAKENGRCAFTGLRTIAYGAGRKFNTKTAEGGVDCGNGVFGDPLPGTVKACYILPQPGK